MNFGIIDIIEIAGTLAFAISGIRLAAAKKFDWFGAYVVGFITATGGGTLRDLLLGVTPFWMIEPSFLIVTAIALITVIALGRRLVHLNNTFFIFDAIGLALFTVVGVQKSLAEGFPFWVAIIMGTITGSFGSIARDVLISESPLVFRRDIYALACLFGGLVYWGLDCADVSEDISQLSAAGTVIAVRLLAVKFKLHMPTIDTDE